jgi:hypothetical protein
MAVGRPGPGQSAWGRLDHRAVLRGAGTFLLIAAPCGVVIALLRGQHLSGGQSTLLAAAVVVLFLVAPGVGGALAGTAGDRAPMTQSAVAVAAPTAVFVVIRILDGAARGTLDAALVTTLILYLLILTGVAVLGGYAAFRRRSRPS